MVDIRAVVVVVVVVEGDCSPDGGSGGSIQIISSA